MGSSNRVFQLIEFCIFSRILFVDGGIVANGGPSGGAGFIDAGDSCRQPAFTPCENIQGMGTCFGVKLPYTQTSTQLVKVNSTQSSLQEELERWEGLRYSPKCWAVIQPLLCSVYMPKCNDGLIELPSQETCKSTRSTCKLVEKDLDGWPEFLKCDDFTKFPTNCKSTEIRELKFNTTTVCMDPMIQVENNFNHYEGFEGCALKCQDPLYQEEKHEFVAKLMFYLGLCLLFLNGGVVVIFLMEWDQSLASKSVFYANFYWLVATTVWMFQFLPNAKSDIVCRKDGTIRRDERSPDENVFCVVIFIVMYGFSMSALQFLIVFVYNLNRICKPTRRERNRDTLPERPTHALIWFFTGVAITIAVSFGQIGGSSITGTCFPQPAHARRIFIILPVEIAAIGVIYLLSQSAYHLYKLTSGKAIRPDGRKEMFWKIFRFVSFSCVVFALASTLIWLDYYEAIGRPQWEKSLRKSIVCRMNITKITECEMKEEPGLTLVIASILLYFFTGVLLSSWAWTGASWRSWIRCISRCCRCGDSSNTGHSVTTRRDENAKTFHNRMHWGNGRLTPSARTTHEDPVGLDKLLNPTLMGREAGEDDQQSAMNSQADGTGDNSSSVYVAHGPNSGNRRGGLIPPHSSFQSEDSRRPSFDSDMTSAANRFQGSVSTLDESSRRRRSKFHRFLRGHLGGKGKRWRAYAGSSTSMESNGGSKILPAITAMIDKKLGPPDVNVQVHNQLIPLKKTIIMKELAIQTSIEKLSVLQPSKHNFYRENGFSLCDKATQSSIRSLHEIGTQTKKSATKKKDKDKVSDIKRVDRVVEHENDNQTTDPVLKLLSPN